ncbi:unnamed protein product [Closterium sp. NIES-54]
MEAAAAAAAMEYGEQWRRHNQPAASVGQPHPLPHHPLIPHPLIQPLTPLLRQLVWSVDTATEAGAGGAAMEYGELLVGSDGGIINRLRVRDIPILSRTTRGCRLMRIASGDSLASLSLVPGAAEGELEEDGVPLVVPERGVSDEEEGGESEEKVEGGSRVKAKVVR